MRLVGATALALFAGLGLYLAPLDPNILALQFSFTGEAFQAVLERWQAGGVALYRSHFGADFALLAAYGAFGLMAGRAHAAAHGRAGALAHLLTWALPAAAVADAGENLLHLWLTGGARASSDGIYLLSGLAASVKWAGFVVFVVCALVAWRRRSV